MPSLDEARSLAGGDLPRPREDRRRRGPEAAPRARPPDRDPRRPPARAARDRVGRARPPRRSAPRSTRSARELEKASGAKKGAITKHLHKLLDQLLSGEELSGDDAELVASIDAKNLERAREIGNGLLRDVLEQAEADAGPEQVRELAYDLCLVEGARKDDLEAVQQWATKVKEMVADMESRREDTREAAVEGVRRLEDTWKLFRELDVKQVVNDEQLFRELKDRFGSPYGFGVYFRGGMGAEAIRELLRDLDLEQESLMLRDIIKTSKGQKQQRAIKRLKVVAGVHHVGEQARVDGARGRARDPAGAPPDGAARRRPLRDERPQRPLPARDQPEQPPEAAARPRRARDHRQQREADAPGGRRRAVRQRPPRSRGDRPGQPAAQVALRHAQGQAGPLPPEPARQARRLLGPLGDRRRAEPQAAPVRAARS